MTVNVNGESQTLIEDQQKRIDELEAQQRTNERKLLDEGTEVGLLQAQVKERDERINQLETALEGSVALVNVLLHD